MANKDSGSCEDFDDMCIFCLMQHQGEETKVLKQPAFTVYNLQKTQVDASTITWIKDSITNRPQFNKELLCFKDIYPAAPHHYLVIPRKHIPSCLSLTKSDISLVERMVELGRAALSEQEITNMTDVRMGFHKPPFISVGHLHLHVLAPASKISDYMLYKFTPGTDFFITEDSLRNRLQRKPDKCWFV